MEDKVYCVDNWWDGAILEGIAKYNNENYHFECIFSDAEDDWSNNYYLTLLNENIFKIAMENWEYWKQWLQQSVIPHPVKYAKKRKTMSVSEIASEIKIANNLLEPTERYYQNAIIIDDYLKNNKPIYEAQGIFCGDIRGINHTAVTWENVRKIN